MTTGHDGQNKHRRRGLALFAVAALGLAGCTTTNIEDVAPIGASVDQPLPQQTSAIPTPAAVTAATTAATATTIAPVSGAAAAAIPEAAGGAAVAAASVDGEVQGTGRDTGQFPNLNIAPVPAAEQLTAADKNAKLAELEAARKQALRGAAGKPASANAGLKKLARTHAADALKEIEGE